MKTKLTIFTAVASLLVSSLSTQATLSVVDVGLIKTNLLNAKRDFAEQLLHGQRALEQIQHLRSQIDQIDDYLDRFGDPKSISIEVFNEAVGFLKEVELTRTTNEILKDLKGEEVFQVDTTSPYSAVSKEIVVDGNVIENRNANVFAPEVAVQRAFSNYQRVQVSVLSRRQKLKAELEKNLQQIKRAATASEVQKLNIITRNIEAQLALTDRELQFAANEAILQNQRNQLNRQIQAKVRVQNERTSLRVTQKRNVQLYQFPSQPIPFKR